MAQAFSSVCVCPVLELYSANRSAGAIFAINFKAVKIHTFARPISSTSGVLFVLKLCPRPHRHTQSLHRHITKSQAPTLGPLWLNVYLSNAIGPPCYPCFSGAVKGLWVLRSSEDCVYSIILPLLPSSLTPILHYPSLESRLKTNPP